MKKFLIIGQGSQTIQFFRKLYGMGIRPDQLKVITLLNNANKSLLEFIKYYEIDFTICNNIDFDPKLNKLLVKNYFNLVVSFSNPFIIDKKHLDKSIFINFHPGKLPDYRGSFSTVHSIINGEKQVGGTWHYINEKVDMGNIIKSINVSIKKKSTSFSLNHQIFEKGIRAFDNVLKLVESENEGIKQKKNQGKFYLNKFPDLSVIEDEDLKFKVNFFPPKFK
jgi:methionyl-tRNA formyltransferase